MADMMSVSNSEIQAFKQCRRKWWLGYYRRLRPVREEATGPRSIGNRVHACVAAYYNGELAPPLRKRGKQPAPTKEQLALDLHDWSVELDVKRLCEYETNQGGEGSVTIRDADKEAAIRKEAEMSRLILEGYFEWLAETGADEGETVIGTERAVEAVVRTPQTDTPVRIMGKLDLLVRREHQGDVVFKDHKTVQEFTTPTKTLHLDEQMLMYHLLLTLTAQEGTDVADGAVYNMLRKVKRTASSKPPFYERFEVRHSAQEVESFMARLLGELEEIVRTRARLDGVERMKKRKARDVARLSVVYPTPSRDCSWKCDFFAVCQLVDRPQDKRGEPLIADLYVEHDPYARYADDAADADAVQ